MPHKPWRLLFVIISAKVGRQNRMIITGLWLIDSSRIAFLCRWWNRVLLQVWGRGPSAAGFRSLTGWQHCAAAQAAASAGVRAEAGRPWRGCGQADIP